MSTIKKLLLLLILSSFISVNAQTKNDSLPPKIYNPQADAKVELAKAVKLADSSNKNVLIQIGGNWCPWCLRLHQFCKNSFIIDSTLKSSYVFTLVNYSKENKNEDILAQLGYPQRFHFPVWVILDRLGKVVHIQDTGLFEAGKGYGEEKIMSVLKNWTIEAMDPKTYQKKK